VDAVRAVLEVLRRTWSGPIVIAEHAALGSTWDGYRNFGYVDLAEEYGATLVDLSQEDYVQVFLRDRDLQTIPVGVAGRVLESDLRIAVGPQKTHDSTIVTLSLKNVVVGSIRERSRFHQGYAVTNLNMYLMSRLVPPHLSVIDGFVGMEGRGPVNGDPVDLRVAIASLDFLAADTVAAAVMGQDPAEVGYLTYCRRAGLGAGELSGIEILGNVGIEEARVVFRRHPEYDRERNWSTVAVERFLQKELEAKTVQGTNRDHGASRE
jgi:uncharacterized protein (DUF362 family)